jgi:hypothetical protein
MAVRQHHAHSWVEAYLPEKGWVIYDPTPADPMFALNSFENPINRALDLLRLNWQRYILSFSINEQAELLSHLQTTGDQTLKSIKALGTLEVGAIKTFIIDNMEFFLGLVALVMVLVIKRNELFRWRFFLSVNPPVYPVWLYREMLKKLSVLGISKEASWTPREFLKRLPALPDDKLKTVRKITDYYEKSRFGQFTLQETEKRDLLRHLKKI